MQKSNISKGMTIEDIFRFFPQKSQQLAQEMSNTGLHCVGCHASTWETLEAGMMGHGMNSEMVDDLVTRLNAIIDQKVDLTTICLTERAATKYIEILKDENKHGWGVRFEEKLAGCNGFEYVLDYSQNPAKDDVIFESHGIEIHVNKKILPRLIGSEIDYLDGLNNSGFKVTNPNVNSSCGCGTSHGY